MVYSDIKFSTFKAVAHGISRIAIAKAQGQKTSSAFWSGFAASGFSIGTEKYGGVAGRTAIMAVVSGTVSQITGGKFANGAVTGAFIHLFNSEVKTIGESFEELGDKIIDGTILNDVKTGVEGGFNGSEKMLLQAPLYAKAPLYVAASITTGGLIVGGSNILMTSPTTMVNVSSFVGGFGTSNPHFTNRYHTAGYLFKRYLGEQ